MDTRVGEIFISPPQGLLLDCDGSGLLCRCVVVLIERAVKAHREAAMWLQLRELVRAVRRDVMQEIEEAAVHR